MPLNACIDVTSVIKNNLHTVNQSTPGGLKLGFAQLSSPIIQDECKNRTMQYMLVKLRINCLLQFCRALLYTQRLHIALNLTKQSKKAKT